LTRFFLKISAGKKSKFSIDNLAYKQRNFATKKIQFSGKNAIFQFFNDTLPF